MPSVLHVTLTRVSPTHHRFACRRADGSSEAVVLETKSCLQHDLLHFALETEARLRRSFYGLLAAGTPYSALASTAPADAAELVATERIVGGLTAVVRHGAPVASFLRAMTDLFAAHGERLPEWLDAQLVERVRERMRRLAGEWRATPFGRAMELRFDCDESENARSATA